MTTALIYCRVSQDRANGRSVAEQENESRALCKQNGWDILEVVTDSTGASRHSKGSRDGWDRCHQLLDRGDADVLVTWEASRAQRDLTAYAKLREVCARTGTLWAYSGNVYDLDDGDDRFRTGLDVLMAEKEAEETSRRIRRSMRANAANGKPHGRRLFGYERVYDPTTGALLNQVPHPTEAPTVQRIYREYVDDASGIRPIARRLNADGITTSTGARWNDSQVRRVLMNASYAGKRIYQGEVVGDAIWEPIIDEALWEQAQEKRESFSANQSRRAPRARLLTGVARCGKCGAKMNVGHDRKARKVYQCRAKFDVSRDEAKLDDYVTEVLLARLAELSLTDFADQRDAPRIRELQDEIVQIEERVSEATEMFVGRQISAGTLNQIEHKARTATDEIRKEIRRLAVPSYVKIPTGNIGEWWDGMERPDRREVVGALIETVIVGPTQRGSRTFDPAAIEIVWRR